MHTPSIQPRPSIYYRYEVFAPWLPSAHAVQTRQQVVIVGAGPAGMVTALELARHGVASVVLSAELQLSQANRRGALKFWLAARCLALHCLMQSTLLIGWTGLFGCVQTPSSIRRLPCFVLPHRTAIGPYHSWRFWMRWR